MSSGGGAGRVRNAAAAAVLGILLSGALAACTYEGPGDPVRTAAAEKSSRPAPSVPTKGPEILDAEKRNYAELEKRLAAAQGPVLLDDSGPADGPGVGFRKSGKVTTAGRYTVMAACVGISSAQLYIAPPGAKELLSLDLDCSGVSTKVVELPEGYVMAALMRHDPNGPWTGAVAGVKITAE
jgi:hypothetical protein